MHLCRLVISGAFICRRPKARTDSIGRPAGLVAGKFCLTHLRLLLPYLIFFSGVAGLLRAGTGTTADGFVYDDDGTTVTITGYTGSGGVITIPSTINGEPVTAIGNSAFYGCSSLTSLTIPNSVTSLGTNAFQSCTGLTDVTIPGSITSIGYYVFAGCSNLTNLTIPGSVTTIGAAAFQSCSSLKNLTIPGSVTSIGDAAFQSCTGLTSLTIPGSVTSLGRGVFQFCTGLASVTLPTSITSIEDYTFYGCSGLTSLAIPASVTSLGNSVFYNCSRLTSLSIPNSVTSLGTNTFQLCSGLTSITLPSGITAIGDYEFSSCSSLTSIVIPASVTSMGNGVFQLCSGLTSITLPAGISTIGDYEFSGCSGLTGITLPDSITYIGQHAFQSCSQLTSITIPAGVTTIGSFAFSGCTNLFGAFFQGNAPGSLGYGAFIPTAPDFAVYYYPSSAGFATPTWQGYPAFPYVPGSGQFKYTDNGTTITLTGFTGGGGAVAIPPAINGKPVTAIASKAFKNCDNLTSIAIPASVTTIGSYAFSTCTNLASVTLPSSVTSLGSAPFHGCIRLAQISVDPANPNYASSGGVLFNKSLTQLIQYPNGNPQASYAIPPGVTSIGSYAFSDALYLASVTIPGSVTTIGSDAFYFTSLRGITIPSSVTSIGVDAFLDCTALTQIDVDSANPAYTSLGGVLFNKSLTQLVQYPAGNSQSSYAIPATVASIGVDAFSYSSSLSAIAIPGSVTSIGNGAFSSSGLTSAVLPASVTSLGTDVFMDCPLLAQINVDVANPAYMSTSGVLFDKTQTQLIQYPAGNTQKSYIVPASVTFIDDYAFTRSSALTTLAIQSHVTTIGDDAFASSGLTSITIPAAVTTIGDDAFADCTALAQINVDASNQNYSSSNGVLFDKAGQTLIAYPAGSSNSYYNIPNGVAVVGADAFFACNHLSGVVIPNTVTSIGDDAFAECIGLTSVNIPYSVTSVGEYAFFDCFNIVQFTVDAANPAYASSNGVLFDKSLARLIQYPIGNSQTSYTIPNSVSFVGDGAFFSSLYLAGVNVPAGVMAIGDMAFSGCGRLARINVDASNPAYASLAGVLFNKSLAELIAYPAGNAQASYTIQSGVVTIDDYAFSNDLALNSVTIPSSIASIGDCAFYYCGNLTGATFQGDAPVYFGDGVFDSAATGFAIYYPSNATGFTTPTWHGYHALPAAAASGPPSNPPPSGSAAGTGGGGGAPSLWFYGALGLLAAAHRLGQGRRAGKKIAGRLRSCPIRF